MKIRLQSSLFSLGLCLGAPVLQAKGPVFVDLSAGAHDADIVSANPAGMTRVADPSWRAGLLVSYSESTWEVTSSGLGQSSESDTDNAVYIPSLAYLRPLGERWAIGASLSATSGMGDDGSEDSVSRYLSTDWSLGSFTFQPSIAYKLTDQWSIGAAVGVNYTAYSWEAAVFNGIGEPDGEVELEPDDINLNYILAAHWSGERTRFGISYRSEYEPNMEDTPDYSGVDPDREQAEDIELDVTIPQSVLAGVYHDFDNGHWVSFDALWIEASEFNIDSGVVDDDGSLLRNPYNLNDTWVFSAGWGMPLNARWDIAAGAMYLHDPIDDDNRSVLLRVDSAWGLGLSADYALGNGSVISGAMSYLFTGDGDVSTPALPIIGVIEGEYTDRTNLLFELSYSW